MIPDWFSALEQAWRLLKPGGWIGVVVSMSQGAKKRAAQSLAQHAWLTRTFWPAWFATDNVFLGTDHLQASKPFRRSGPKVDPQCRTCR